MKILPRVKWNNLLNGEGYPDCPFIMDTRSHDIPNQIAGFIKALPQNCIALSLRYRGGHKMARRAEREARKKNIRILWLF